MGAFDCDMRLDHERQKSRERSAVRDELQAVCVLEKAEKTGKLKQKRVEKVRTTKQKKCTNSINK